MSNLKLEIGKTYSCDYPFVKCKVPDYEMIQSKPDCDCPFNDCGCFVEVGDVDSWKPGTSHEPCEDFGYGTGYEVRYCDALGKMILTIISIHKPGKYPERVFYIRQWQDPDGKVFGKNNLRMTTTVNFKRLLKGYRHEFEVD